MRHHIARLGIVRSLVVLGTPRYGATVDFVDVDLADATVYASVRRGEWVTREVATMGSLGGDSWIAHRITMSARCHGRPVAVAISSWSGVEPWLRCSLQPALRSLP